MTDHRNNLEDIAIREAVVLYGRLWDSEAECERLRERQRLRDAASRRTLWLVAVSCAFVLVLAWAIGTALAEWGAR